MAEDPKKVLRKSITKYEKPELPVGLEDWDLANDLGPEKSVAQSLSDPIDPQDVFDQLKHDRESGQLAGLFVGHTVYAMAPEVPGHIVKN